MFVRHAKLNDSVGAWGMGPNRQDQPFDLAPVRVRARFPVVTAPLPEAAFEAFFETVRAGFFALVVSSVSRDSSAASRAATAS